MCIRDSSPQIRKLNCLFDFSDELRVDALGQNASRTSVKQPEAPGVRGIRIRLQAVQDGSWLKHDAADFPAPAVGMNAGIFFRRFRETIAASVSLLTMTNPAGNPKRERGMNQKPCLLWSLAHASGYQFLLQLRS